MFLRKTAGTLQRWTHELKIDGRLGPHRALGNLLCIDGEARQRQ